jgi:long-chain acyl-CoA synthetase
VFADAVAAASAGLPDPVEVLTRLPGGIAGPDPAVPPSDDPAVILYTSGTTARPKGVTHSSRTLAAMADAMRDAGVAVDSVTLVATPAMHVSGLCATLLSTMAAGGTAVLLPAFDPAALLDAVEHHRCNHVLGLPALMQFVASEQERRPRDTRSVRTWLCGGDSVPLPLQERWLALFGSPLIEGYAMSEDCPMACNRASAIRPGSIGRPVTGTEIRIMGYDGVPSPIGTIGEIEARGPANFIGYWDDPEATARTLVDGWLRTGDLGRFDADGYLWFEGRRKEIIVRGGSNIAPQEVEEALLGHPAVLEAGVVGVPDPVFGERVVAFVALREGHAATADEVREFAGRTLADYKLPERVVFLETMPKGPTGKVLRRALKELASA